MFALIRNDSGSTVVDLHSRRSAVSEPRVSVHVRTADSWKIITVNGDMDMQVLPLLPDLRGGVAEQVVLDLRGVTFIDVGALRAVLHRQQWVTQSGGCMRLVAHSRPVLRLMALTGTSDLIHTFDTLDRALHTPITTAPSST